LTIQLHIGKYVTGGTAQIFAHGKQTNTRRFEFAQVDIYLPEVTLLGRTFLYLT